MSIPARVAARKFGSPDEEAADWYAPSVPPVIAYIVPQITQCRLTESVHRKIACSIIVRVVGFEGSGLCSDSGRDRRGEPIITIDVSGLCVRMVGELGVLSELTMAITVVQY